MVSGYRQSKIEELFIPRVSGNHFIDQRNEVLSFWDRIIYLFWFNDQKIYKYIKVTDQNSMDKNLSYLS